MPGYAWATASALHECIKLAEETLRTSWPSSLTMRKSQGSLGVTGTSQASPYLLVMPIQSLSAPFICTSLIDP